MSHVDEIRMLIAHIHQWMKYDRWCRRYRWADAEKRAAVRARLGIMRPPLVAGEFKEYV